MEGGDPSPCRPMMGMLNIVIDWNESGPQDEGVRGGGQSRTSSEISVKKGASDPKILKNHKGLSYH